MDCLSFDVHLSTTTAFIQNIIKLKKTMIFNFWITLYHILPLLNRALIVPNIIPYANLVTKCESGLFSLPSYFPNSGIVAYTL